MIGERVVCIKKQTLGDILKIGKQFTIRDIAYGRRSDGNEYYVVVSDSGEIIGWIESTYFKPLSEARLDKLKELGI